MKRLTVLTALLLFGGAANAAIYGITGGNWDLVGTCSNNASDAVSCSESGEVYDNGEVPPAAVLGGTPGIINWTIGDTGVEGNPPAQTGTYSGTIITDDVTGDVIGGSLVVTGTIGKEIQVGFNSWWYLQYTDLTVPLVEGGIATSASQDCWRTALAPAGCFGPNAGALSAWNPSSGNETYNTGVDPDPDNPVDGPARAAVEFDPVTGLLRIFKEGYSPSTPAGSDLYHDLTLDVQIIPVPAAVWLFGSALGLLGWARRRV